MRSKNRGATIAVGIGLALAAATPVAQAKAPSVDRPATSFYTARALNALDQRWNAEAASFAPGRALRGPRCALDARGSKLRAALKARSGGATVGRPA